MWTQKSTTADAHVLTNARAAVRWSIRPGWTQTTPTCFEMHGGIMDKQTDEVRTTVLRIQQAILAAIPAGSDHADVIYALTLALRDVVASMKAGKRG